VFASPDSLHAASDREKGENCLLSVRSFMLIAAAHLRVSRERGLALPATRAAVKFLRVLPQVAHG